MINDSKMELWIAHALKQNNNITTSSSFSLGSVHGVGTRDVSRSQHCAQKILNRFLDTNRRAAIPIYAIISFDPVHTQTGMSGHSDPVRVPVFSKESSLTTNPQTHSSSVSSTFDCWNLNQCFLKSKLQKLISGSEDKNMPRIYFNQFKVSQLLSNKRSSFTLK